ncbi:MFS transporter [Streptomyces niveiscabiei]|uniref:MFS transporter n=2 Tax=Streptomyces niveiscabiei TaxID=164115 RepID=UPI003EBE21D8
MRTLAATRRPALVALLIAEAMNLLDATVVQVAAPVVHTDLGGPVSDVQWFTAAYTLPFAVLLVLGGRLGDIVGRRRVFVTGVAGFAVVSAGCALAPSAGVLIALRAVQGAAAAAVVPQTVGLIKAMFSGPELPRALGWIGPVMGLAGVCGPLLGGVLTHTVSWRAAFLVNVPLAVAVLVLARSLPEDRAPLRPALDLTGTGLVALGTGLVVHPLIGVSGVSGVSLVAGAAVLAVFVLHQRRTPEPLLERSLFAQRGFPAALFTSMAFFAATGGLTTVVVLHLQLGLGEGVLASSLALAPWSLGLAVASWAAGAHLVRRYGRRLMPVGLGVLVAGILGALGGPLPVGLAVVGVGAGLFTPAFFTLALSALRPQETGSAAGLLNAVQQLGATLGVAVLGRVYLDGTLQLAFLAGVSVIGVSAVGVWGMGSAARRA